jgi:hypothetical protein
MFADAEILNVTVFSDPKKRTREKKKIDISYYVDKV